MGCFTGTERRARRLLGLCAVIGVFGFMLAACDSATSKTAQARYVTYYGLGPDKWATAWLLTRHVDPVGKLIVVDSPAPLPDGIVFDDPSSALRRVDQRAAFQVTKDTYRLNSPTLDKMASVVHEIEINFWNTGGAPEASLIETAYRQLQYQQGRASVAPECYLAFFDRVYQVLNEQLSKGRQLTAESLQLGCDELVKNAARSADLIPEIPLVDVMGSMAAGRKVIFVDVREPDEYAEAHIPGALNIPIRDVSPQLQEHLAGADYVVSYCVKDFRGFEMAKALAEVGVKNSVIMRPYGIKGWIAQGLPVVGTQGLSKANAEAELTRCLTAAESCKTQKGTT